MTDVYLVSYDLHNADESDYEILTAYLKQYDTLEIQRSVWLVVSASGAQGLLKLLAPLVPAGANLWISRVDHDHACVEAARSNVNWLEKHPPRRYVRVRG